MPDESSWLFEQQRMADDRIDKMARSYCGAGEGGWCNYLVHEDQLKQFPPGMLCFARACRFMLMFFITFCVIGLITGWALEGSMTVLEEIDTKTEMPVPSLALCPQPWGSTFGRDITVKDAHIFSIPGGKEGPPVKWRTVTCPTGLKSDDTYGLDAAGLEGYTGIQTGRGHGFTQQQQQQTASPKQQQVSKEVSIEKMTKNLSQGEKQTNGTHEGSHGNGTRSMLTTARSTAPAPAPQWRDAAALAAHQGGKVPEGKPGKPPLSHRRWGQQEEDAKRRVSLAFMGEASPGLSLLQTSARGVSSAQAETVKREHSQAGGVLDGCFCINLEQNILHFRGERGNVKDLDYVKVSLANLENSNPLNQQFAFGFYLAGMVPQQWTYGNAGQITEGDLRSEEVATGKTEFSDGTAVPRYAFRQSGATQSPDGVTTLVFGYDKYLSYVIASFASKFSFFAMMTLIITCCAAINNFGLFEIVFPERSDEGPPELEPNLFLRSILGYCCYCCTLSPEAQKKDDEEAT